MEYVKRYIGRIGEDLAWDHLKKQGHRLKDRNYLRKWGEIDIITVKDGLVYFIEVKTVTRSYTCNSNDSYRAEDNVHLYKIERLKRTIQTYLLGMKREVEWKFEVIMVTLHKESLELMKIEREEGVVL